MDNVYQSTFSTNARNEEFSRGANMWEAAKDPWATGVVPAPAYASMFAGGVAEVSDAALPTGTMASMSGESIPLEHFTFNNMVPFFKGNATQSMDVDRGSGKLDAFTGRQPFYEHKKEMQSFFEPTADLAHVYGAPDATDVYKSRIVQSAAQRNFFPIGQERVGPGLNDGYSATPTGGRHNVGTLEYVRPKTTDQLRATNNPKETYNMPIAAPPKYTAQRGELGAVEKNRPDTSFEQTQDQWLQTTGAFRRPTERAEVVLKATAKAGINAEYAGPAYGGLTKPGAGIDTDHGKASICVYDNSRQTTQKTNVSNLRSLVNAVIAPLLDVFRRTPKEYTVEASRTYGNMSAQVPNKATVYDPVNHAMRTTIKETLIHDAEIGNLHSRVESGVVNADDAARTTVRETTPTQEGTRNIASRTYRVTVYNTEEVARRTHREMLENAANIAGYKGEARTHVGAYTTTDVELPLTQKQFVSDSDHYGGAGAQAEFAPTSREAAEAMRVDGTREMQMGKAGYTPNAQGASAGMDGSDVNLDVRKLVGDAFAPRTFGSITKAYVNGDKPIEACEVTKQAMTLPQVDADRLDPSVLSTLKTNPYKIKLNPILEC